VEVDDAFFDALGVADVHARAVLEAVAVGIHSNGEPGFYNSSLASVGERAGADVRSTNPCGEIGLEEWEQCCLGHVNLAAFSESHSKALAAFRYMSRYLVRATFGSSSDVRQERVKGRNRRIGVGFFGFHDWAALQGVRFDDIPGSPELRRRLVEYREIVEESAHLYADELGIARPIKTTCVAPTGSIAKLPGVSEGIQPPYSRFFVRRIRYADNDPKLLELPGEQEPCLYSPATTVVSFPCREAVLDRVSDSLVMQSNEVSLEAYLEVQALVQKLYADNAISITANFHRDAATVEDLASLLQKYLPVIKGFTAMPEDGRPQSPYERISSADYYAAGSRGVGQAIDDCAAGACPIR